MTDTPTTPTEHLRNQHALRRRFLRALAELGLQTAVPADNIQISGGGFTIGSLSVGQLAALTNVLEDAAGGASTIDPDQSPSFGELTQPDRLPVSFTAARIPQQLVNS